MEQKILSISTLFDISNFNIQELIVDFVVVFSVVYTLRWVAKEVRVMLDSYARAKEEEHKSAEVLKELASKTYQQQEDIDSLKLALKELLADRLAEKYKYYKKLEYIPEDEYDQYCDMHKVYNKLGGNHTGDYKFDQSMDLPVR